MFGFEKLDVWRKAIDFADAVYDFTGNFPSDERFGLTSQMRRAAMSISSNIAEGSRRGSTNDYIRFLGIAYGSVMEVVSQSQIALRRNLLTQEQRNTLYTRAEELSRMLSGLRAALQKRRDSE